MTKEEAIEEINKVFEPAFANYIIIALTEGVTASDKALKQEPCEDAVSRQHLLSEIDKLMQSPWFHSGENDLGSALHYGYVERKEAVEIVRDLCVKAEPPVTSARPKGEWIRRSIQSADCSVCGHIQTVYGQDLTGKCHIHKALFKFCPNCGARMGGVNE